MTRGAVSGSGAFLLLLALSAQSAPGPDPAGVVQRVRAWRKTHEVAIVHELAALLRQPNVASDREGIERSATAIAAILQRRGIRTELLRVEGAPPAVYGEIPSAGARRTILVYAHYDGQPVDPTQWSGGPWIPALRDRPVEAGGREIPWDSLHEPLDPEWRLYGRSSSDDKAPIVGWMAALDALRAVGIPPSVNVKFLFEGEEEAGSPHLGSLLEAHASRLRGDVWLFCDGPVHPTRRMQVYFGARGITEAELTVYGAARRLHSGHYGNWAPNPIAELAGLLAGIRDDHGRIRIDRFEEDVRPLIAAEKDALAKVPDADRALAHDLALGRTESPGESLIQAIHRPAVNFRGIAGGDVGDRATNSIPTEASVSIDFRLVPDQTPQGVRERFEAHLRRLGYRIVTEAPDASLRRESPRLVRLRWGTGYPAARTSMDLPVSRAVLRLLDQARGEPVIRLPSLGGSIPIFLFFEKLRTPVIGIPIANHDNNQHAANENLRLQNLWDGIETYAALLADLPGDW
jgi:acetylornithine deacetylase/succinyl-diaminopimelate desuccinylase-like protein